MEMPSCLLTSAKRVAEIQGANDQKIGALQTSLDDLSRALEEKIG